MVIFLLLVEDAVIDETGNVIRQQWREVDSSFLERENLKYAIAKVLNVPPAEVPKLALWKYTLGFG